MADGERYVPRYDIGTIYGGAPGAVRDRERYLVCLDVVQSLRPAYCRPEAPVPLAGIGGVSVAELRKRASEQPTFCRMLAQYRDVVLRHEEQSARRLECLRCTVRTLLDLRERADVVDTIDRMLEELGHFVAVEWNVDLPTERVPRDWSLKLARRYDLLSPALRYL